MKYPAKISIKCLVLHAHHFYSFTSSACMVESWVIKITPLQVLDGGGGRDGNSFQAW
jgi:hypothetical protein